MASQDSKSRFYLWQKLNLFSVTTTFEVNDCPSDTVPGGATSPALAFKLYSKGSKIPNNEFHQGQFDDAPLGSLETPTMPSEVLIRARDLAAHHASVARAEAEAKAAEEAAKQAEIDAKIKFADENGFSSAPPPGGD